MADLIDFTGKDLPDGATIAMKPTGVKLDRTTTPAKPKGLTNFTGKSLPAGATVGRPSALSGAGGAAFERPEGWPAYLAKRGIEIGGATLGGLAGGALGLGAAVPEGMTVAGIPAAAATEYGSVRAGEAAGLTAADVINAGIAKNIQGRPIEDITAKGLGEDFAANLGGTVVGSAVTPALGKVGRAILGKGEIETAAREAGTAATAAKESFEQKATSAQADADRSMLDARRKLLEQVKPEAKDEAVAGGIQRSPETTQRALYLSREGAANRRSQFFDTIYGPKNREADELGKRFDNLFKPHISKSVDSGAIGQTIADEEAYAATNNVAFSRPVNQLLEEGKDLSRVIDTSPNRPVTYQDLGITPEEWKTTDPATRKAIEERAGRFKSSIKGASQVQPPTPKAAATVGQLLGYRSKLGEAMAGAEGADRAALNAIRESVDDVLAKSGVPGADKLRAQYSLFSKIYGKNFLRGISGTIEPSDTAKAIFQEPQRIKGMLDKATPEERGTLRDLYGDAFNRGIIEPTKEQQPILAKLYPGTPLAKPEGWVFEKRAVDNLGEVLQNSPQARQKYTKLLGEESEKVRGQYADEIVKDALAETKSLGATGKRIEAAIKAAKTPTERAKVALDAMTALSPEKAGTEAIQNMQRPKGRWDRWKTRAEIWAVLLPATAMAGHASSYAGAGLLGAGLLGAREGVAAAYRASLRDPARAARFYAAMMNPGVESNLRYIAREAVTASVGDLASKPIKAETGVSLEKPKLPAIVEEDRARNIAGPKAAPEKIDAVKDTVADIRSGKTPDIQEKLRSGRITNRNVRQMLDGGKPNVASLFDGLTPQQSIDALRRANPEERETYLPIVAQRLQDMTKGMPKDQQQALLAQLRTAMEERV